MPPLSDAFSLEIVEDAGAVTVELVEQPDVFLGNVVLQTPVVTTTADDAFALAVVEEVLLVEVLPETPDLFLETGYLQGPAGTPGVGSVGMALFTGQTSITVDHYRGYRPIVSLSDLAGRDIDGAVEHTSFNTFTVSFNLPQSGRVTYF
jgi:hypothetical protein